MNLPLRKSAFAIPAWQRGSGGDPATLVWALVRNASESGKRVAIRERNLGIWQEVTWAQMLPDTLATAAALDEIGLQPNQALTIIGDNRPRLYIAMLAAMVLRAFPSPVYPDVPPEELKNYTRFGKPEIAVAEDQEQVDKLLELKEATGRPATIIYDDPRGLGAYGAPGLMSFDELIERGRRRLEQHPALVGDLLGRCQPDDIAGLLHSSGTTGAPKGVPIRHRNILAGIANAAQGGGMKRGEEFFAYLPMAWIGDFVFTLGGGIALTGTINIPERQETALHDLREVCPTYYLAAPRAWDNMLTRIQVGIEDSTPLKRRLFKFFMPRAIALERKRLSAGEPSLGERMVHRLGEALVYGPLKDTYGLGRAGRAFTGGEALGEDTFLFFRALGIRLKQIYGQTETCAITAAQSDTDVKMHTVGKPLPGVEVRIGEDGEVQVKSGSVVDGYYDDPEATAKAFTPDRWLKTGDAGYLEPDGQLVVLGRVSEVVHTAAGERYIPNYIENRIKFSPYVRNVAVVGANRPELTAIVCIDFEAVGHWGEERAISYTSYADLSQKPEVYQLIAGVLRHVNEALLPHQRIRRFVNLHKDFDADDGEITRTRKLRRNVIEERYAQLIEALYGRERSVEFDAIITYETGDRGVIRRNLTIVEVE